MPNTREIHFLDEVGPDQILSGEKSEQASVILMEGIQEGKTPAYILNKIHEEIELTDMEWSVLMMGCGILFSDT
jgi:hypothetical protein